ncbi:MAG: hypothetical protein HFJ54_06150 [Clostridia bacterium]|nr:hypothetical protein [Clostridia bacterium]
MAFIGIITESKNEIQMKRILDNKLNAVNKKHTVIVINEKSIDNIRNIRFETILVMTLEEITSKKNILNELFENTKYLVINYDMDSKELEIINNMNLNVITFGFNQKSSITASSVEDKLIICLQRKLIDIDKKEVEPQEIEVKIIGKKFINNTHNSMGIASILLIYGEREIFF